MGDRATLLRAAGRWVDWPVRLHAIDAALLEGDVDRASAIAKRYAEFDPRDEDLRANVGGVLCLGADPKRGLELLQTVERERAGTRHAGMARNWGDIRAVIVACAAIAKVAPPAKPREDAGQNDLVAARAAQRIRLTTRTIERSEAIEAGIAMLRGPIRARGGRLALLAEVLATGVGILPEVMGDLAAPHVDDGEAPLVAPDPMTIAALLGEPPGVRATARIDALLDGVDALLNASKVSASGATSAGAISGDMLAAVLRRAAGAMLLEAGSSIARSGRGDEAENAMKLGGELALGDPDLRRIARSSAYHLAGDAARALDELDRDDSDPSAAVGSAALGVDPPRTLAHRACCARSKGGDLGVARQAQRRRDRGPRGRRARRRGRDERGCARRLGVHAVDASGPRARRRPRSPRRRHGRCDPKRATSLSMDRIRRGDDGLGASRGSQRRRDRRDPRSLERGRRTSAGGSPRRSLRGLRPPRGRPPAHVAYLSLAADLLGQGEGNVELWLDTFDAFDARRFTLRAYAWYRAEAARWRGDAENAATWSTRFHALGVLAADPARAEIAQYLGI